MSSVSLIAHSRFWNTISFKGDMDIILFPFLIYYRLLANLLQFGEWVIGIGIILLIIIRIKFSALRKWSLNLPPLVRQVTIIVMLLGAFGSMPSTFLFGAVGGELGAGIGNFINEFIGVQWKAITILGGLIGGVVSVIALIGWSLLLWGIIGVVFGYGLDKARSIF